MTELVTTALSACDREPIHVPNSIQPHGVLLVLSDPELRVLQCSTNVATIFKLAPERVLRSGADELLSPAAYDKLSQAVLSNEINAGFSLDVVLQTDTGPKRYNIIAHRSGNHFVVEFEPADDDRHSTRELYSGIRYAATRIQNARSVAELCEVAVQEVRTMTGYDRVMVYRFDSDWNGAVVAEARSPDVESYLGLHFPHTDIPRQARALYRKNWLRMIPDIHYAPVPILPIINPADHRELDLSFSVLRSVSPIHLQYLENMGLAASMSISLLKNGELWGLIACHHTKPLFLPYSVRLACEFYGRTASLQLAARDESEHYQYRMTLKSVQTRIIEAMSFESDIAVALTTTDPNILALVGADGAAICIENTTLTVGQTPSLGEIDEIIGCLREESGDDLFLTAQLGIDKPRFAKLSACASGLLAMPISRARGEYILWFRRETVLDVRWAGEPVKKEIDGILQPRTSFANWQQTVRQTSRRWEAAEIEAAIELQSVIIAMLNKRTDEVRRLNVELRHRNEELNMLAHVTSHDLKEPLRGIHNYANYLLDDYGEILDEAGKQKLLTLVSLTKRMHGLIDSLAQLSRVSRVELDLSPTSLDAVFEDLRQLYKPRFEEHHAELIVAEQLPTVRGDRFWITEILSNLLSNALKYNDKLQTQIEIGVLPKLKNAPAAFAGDGEAAPDYVTIFIKDNGIGISPKYIRKIFTMFTRLHAADEFGGGTGAGLAISAKIAERLEGELWATSIVGEGTTMFLKLPAGAPL